MWGSILEKAWAKVRGNYIRANGDTVENGIAALTGVPVLSYKCEDITDAAGVTAAYNIMKAAEDAHYIMGAQTGSGSDSTYNRCSIANGHAYSIHTVFEMTDATGTKHKMALIRNPWGVTYYNGTWSKNDANWTDALVA